ncbi:hypothetical protein ILYODFUR_005515 [Ilyodon furcidens]|uniref:Ig-like domain-containing protein n=1 Tax=Ilyodon furcidens TaxID=33524 RepID=A0ABV0VBB2_9TELE
MTEIKKKDKKGKKKGGKKGQKEKEGDPATAAAPKLKPIKNPIIVGEGNKLTVKCEATGNPVPTYRWFKDGNELKKSRKVKIKSNLKFSRVQISSAKLEDSGNYTCVVENPLGKDNSTGTVNVQGDQEPILTEEAAELHSSARPLLSCSRGEGKTGQIRGDMSISRFEDFSEETH